MKFVKFIKEAEKKQVLNKYMNMGNTFRPVGSVQTIKELESGIYMLKQDMQGIYFELHDIKTDKLLKFKDKRFITITEEIDKFWNIKDNFDKFGFTHKRGILLYGEPGTGKTCLLKQVIENAVKKGHVVLIAKNPTVLVSGIKQLKEVERDRKVLIILEDIDEMVRYDEHALLELFDGDLQEGNVCFLATTNYVEKLPPRMLRASRLDRKIEIPCPPFEGRKAYLEEKLKDYETNEKIEELAEKMKGFNFGQLREFVVARYCLNNPEDEVLKRLRDNFEGATITEAELDEKLSKLEKKDDEFLKEMLI